MGAAFGQFLGRGSSVYSIRKNSFVEGVPPLKDFCFQPGTEEAENNHWIIRRIRGGSFRMRVWRSKDDRLEEPTPHRAENRVPTA